jgi:uncharacterized small protein (DUF1192 family)
MDSDDLDPPKPKTTLRPLDDMTVADLEGYIADLEAEIARVRAWIAVKGGIQSAADALFRT